MKRTVSFFVIVCLFITGCAKNEYESAEGGDFWLKMGDGSVVSTSDIDYYDVSTHMIYLKKEAPYLEKIGHGSGTMSVYVKDVEIYTCSFHPTCLSSFPIGAYIHSGPSVLSGRHYLN